MYAIKHLQATSGTWYWVVNFSRAGKLIYKRFYEPMYGGVARLASIASPPKLASHDFGKVEAVFPHWRHTISKA